jgi:hypothetical protein
LSLILKSQGLKLPGIYRLFKFLRVSEGVSFKYRALAFNNEYDLYVVDWEPNKKFVFGHHLNDWKFKFEVIDGG